MARTAIFTGYRGHIHTCSPGRLQGHLWVILTIGSCFCGLLRLISVSVSGLLPHTRSETPQNTVFGTQNTTFWVIKDKKIFFQRPQCLFYDKGNCQNGMSLFQTRPFGRQKRTWATWGKTTSYPHDAGKIGQIFKSRIFHET